jgi:urea transport system substrate-binding protein
LGGELVGETYLPFGSVDPTAAIDKIRASKPDVILSTVVGDSNAPLYRALKSAGLDPKQVPVVSFSISETEAEQISNADIAGHYSAWNYFQTIHRPENTAFLKAFRDRYGANRVVSDVMETAYISVKLWAQAAERANSVAAEDVNQALMGLSYNAPEGIVTIDPATRHTWRAFNIGKIGADGGITIVWSAGYPIRPVPYPRSRSVSDWDDLLQNLYVSWNHNWVNLSSSGAKSGQP